MDAYEVARIKLIFKLLHCDANEVDRVACDNLSIIVGRDDPNNGRDGYGKEPIAFSNK